MGKDSPSPPQAPDPVKTAQEQTKMNKETAYWNAVLNNVNQVTPYGNLTYTQSGGGKTYDEANYQKAMDSYTAQMAARATQPRPNYSRGLPNIGSGAAWGGNLGPAPVAPNRKDFLLSDAPPSFTSTIELSPEQKALYDTKTRSDQAMATLGEEQIGRIRDSVSTPYSYDGISSLYGEGDLNAARTKTEEAIYSRLDPQFARDEEALRTRLVNQGIGLGSEAYNTEMQRFSQAKNDARMQAVLAGGQESDRLFNQSLRARNQGISEYDAQRNAPLNEYIGLTSGTQVQNPQFSTQGYQGAAPVDYASLVNNKYQADMNRYNQQVASGNSTMGSLFSLGGTIAGSFLGNPAMGSMIGGMAGRAAG